MSYEFDIFLSYPRGGQVGPWVHNHFLPVLSACLDVHLAHEPRIFVDSEQPTGERWPQRIQEALLRSRLMVAVWTPPYFRSDWCIAEWSSMLERQSRLAQAGHRLERGLVYPVVYSDGKHFHARAKETQYKWNLSAFTYPYPSFKESAAYLQFHDAVMLIAQEIEHHLGEVPDWQPDWPIVVPQPSPAARVGLPRI